MLDFIFLDKVISLVMRSFCLKICAPPELCCVPHHRWNTPRFVLHLDIVLLHLVLITPKVRICHLRTEMSLGVRFNNHHCSHCHHHHLQYAPLWLILFHFHKLLHMCQSPVHKRYVMSGSVCAQGFTLGVLVLVTFH